MLDLHHERSPTAQHAHVDVLAALRVECARRCAEALGNGGGYVLLHRALALPYAVDDPRRLRKRSDELEIPASEEQALPANTESHLC